MFPFNLPLFSIDIAKFSVDIEWCLSSLRAESFRFSIGTISAAVFVDLSPSFSISVVVSLASLSPLDVSKIPLVSAVVSSKFPSVAVLIVACNQPAGCMCCSISILRKTDLAFCGVFGAAKRFSSVNFLNFFGINSTSYGSLGASKARLRPLLGFSVGVAAFSAAASCSLLMEKDSKRFFKIMRQIMFNGIN
ncbi:hypothetical protein FF38_12984 [Lucilia cuprina]|uniref:Uncharacterized protein n=1 Tax=Lucilia cuprina TaxID=7375 RepID=A0A0L0BZZ7_LUCCU|nr:hypothetical protein FF38_12984 [Lucilia cuprina]